jgi:hypothetical protein
MEAASCSETLLTTDQTERCHNSEDHELRNAAITDGIRPEDHKSLQFTGLTPEAVRSSSGVKPR